MRALSRSYLLPLALLLPTLAADFGTALYTNQLYLLRAASFNLFFATNCLLHPHPRVTLPLAPSLPLAVLPALLLLEMNVT